MKKNIFLFVLLLISVSLMHGQTTHYQLPNNNFDNWGGGGDMPIPIYWYSFSNTACVMSSSTCDMVVAAGGFDNHHARVTGYNGTGKAIQLYAVEKVGRTVNGLLTTGKSILASEDLSDPLHPTYCVDRPHIIYCQKTGKYVCWIKVMASEIAQFMTILQADRFEGPYVTVKKFYNPLDMYCGDFALHVDDEKGKAYIWFERPHFQLVCATLTDDFTGVTKEYSIHYDGLIPPYTREAPTFFERNGKKYLFTSGTSGYYPNRTDVCTFTDYHGEYISLGNPCISDKSGTTFNSQITCVIRVPGTDRYVAMADRWMPGWYIPKLSNAIIKGM